jgi:hypothetical protein
MVVVSAYLVTNSVDRCATLPHNGRMVRRFRLSEPLRQPRQRGCNHELRLFWEWILLRPTTAAKLNIDFVIHDSKKGNRFFPLGDARSETLA